jgi:ABC-type multidrug transport system ATPase subunit
LSRRPVLLLDEPTTGLDNQNLGLLVVLLEALSETKIIVLTSHDKRLEEFNFKSFYITNFILECHQMVNRTIEN